VEKNKQQTCHPSDEIKILKEKKKKYSELNIARRKNLCPELM